MDIVRLNLFNRTTNVLFMTSCVFCCSELKTKATNCTYQKGIPPLCTDLDQYLTAKNQKTMNETYGSPGTNMNQGRPFDKYNRLKTTMNQPMKD